ncbi:MAG TPA: hypothetical protein VMV25_06840 [Steroidobacteraceae bacterium]|nr:hypothetical protein [Steroidobacteraceae bacterium]
MEISAHLAAEYESGVEFVALILEQHGLRDRKMPADSNTSARSPGCTSPVSTN